MHFLKVSNCCGCDLTMGHILGKISTLMYKQKEVENLIPGERWQIRVSIFLHLHTSETIGQVHALINDVESHSSRMVNSRQFEMR